MSTPIAVVTLGLAELRAELAPLHEKIERLERALAACAPAATERLDVGGLARMMKLTPAAVRQLIHRRRDFPRLHVGRRVFFEAEAVRRWCAENDRGREASA